MFQEISPEFPLSLSCFPLSLSFLFFFLLFFLETPGEFLNIYLLNKFHFFSSRFLLDAFVEARCLDWVIILSLMTNDQACFSQVVDKVFTFKDMTKTRLDTLMSALEDLNDWLEEKW